jgi:putative nucleotidyltransferase with HDIG domain
MGERGMIEDPRTGAVFVPVPIPHLRVDTITDFNLYLKPREEHIPVLYRHKNLAFTQETCNRLRESNVDVLFVDSIEEDTYRHYLERHLAEVLTDPHVTVETKCTIVYTSARGLVKDVLEDPRSGTMISRSSTLVEHMTDFMLKEKTALESLMKVTSFDYYTYTHSVNVYVFGVSLLQRLGADADTLRRYGMGGLLHDVGKSMIDPAIINCRGKLSAEQWEMMKMHPVYGCEILEAQGVRDDLVFDVTRHHHEKLSGRGYPDGLTDGQLSRFVRVTTIADIFDALTTKRSYKEAMPSYLALKLIKDEMMPTDVDMELYRAFVVMIGNPTA